jgi:hypothetical protein
MEKILYRVKEFAGTDVRYILLLFLVFFLPSFEALKNISALLFVLSWFYVAKRNNDWGGKWQIIDTILLLWILGDIIISINAVITHQLPGDNFRDILRFILVGWALSRTNFSNARNTQLVIVALVSVITSLIYSYISGNGELKELYSVGHINHTAIYLLISYSISLTFLLFNFNKLYSYQKIIIALTTIIFFLTTIDTDSRAAFGGLIVVSLVNFTYLIAKARKLYLTLGVFVLYGLIGIFFITNPPTALERIFYIFGPGQKIERENIFKDNARYKINQLSYYAFKKNPLLGIGFGNFSQIKTIDIKEEVIKNKGVFDPNNFLRSAHTHNVYYNYLVSGGLLIFSIFTWFWLYIFWIIYKLRKIIENDWIVACSASVAFINLAIGFFNTTLHHEHAILSMFVFGLLISEYRSIKGNLGFNKIK